MVVSLKRPSPAPYPFLYFCATPGWNWIVPLNSFNWFSCKGRTIKSVNCSGEEDLSGSNIFDIPIPVSSTVISSRWVSACTLRHDSHGKQADRQPLRVRYKPISKSEFSSSLIHSSRSKDKVTETVPFGSVNFEAFDTKLRITWAIFYVSACRRECMLGSMFFTKIKLTRAFNACQRSNRYDTEFCVHIILLLSS